MGRVLSLPLALLAFAAVATAVNIGMRTYSPNRFPAYRKVDEAAADQSVNAVFFGTSRIEYGVRPEIFDAAMQRHGIAGIRSFNAAQAGSGLLESYAAIERFLDHRPHDVRYVLFEPDFTGQFIIREPDTLRAIDFFGLRNAVRVGDYLNFPLRGPAPQIPPSTYTRNVARAAFRHYFDLGIIWSVPDPEANDSPGSRGYPDRNPHVLGQYQPDEAYAL